MTRWDTPTLRLTYKEWQEAGPNLQVWYLGHAFYLRALDDQRGLWRRKRMRPRGKCQCKGKYGLMECRCPCNCTYCLVVRAKTGKTLRIFDEMHAHRPQEGEGRG